MTDEFLGIKTVEVNRTDYHFCDCCGKLITGDYFSSCEDNYQTIMCLECEGEGDLNEH